MWICVLALGFLGTPTPTDWLGLARKAVECEVRGHNPPVPTTKTAPKPVFVTIERSGAIRGCRGSLQVRSTSLENEIVLAARAAARHDPRYKPVREEELGQLVFTLTIIDSLAPIPNVRGLRKQDGLLLRQGERIGIVLPFEGSDPETRLEWAYRKAKADRRQPVALELVTARRYRS